jgi:hypothetical protein
MEVRIGVIYSPKELEVDMGDEADRDKVVADIEEAMGREAGILWLVDRKGRRVGVVTSKLAWVEVGPESEGRRVGFSAL